MKYSLSLTVLFVALLSAPAFGDHLYLAPNCCGDNFGYTSRSLRLFGGTDPWFLSSDGYAPGSTVGGEGALYLYSTFVTVGGESLEFYFYPGSIFMSSFTLPTNGKDFRALVGIGFNITGINYDTERTIDLNGGAHGSISFYFSDATGLYYASDFVQAPEPATFGLIATGLTGIAVLVRKRFCRY